MVIGHNLEDDHPRRIAFKFGPIRNSGFCEEDQNLKEKFEETKEIIRNQMAKDRQGNSQMNKENRTNNNPQHITTHSVSIVERLHENCCRTLVYWHFLTK